MNLRKTGFIYKKKPVRPSQQEYFPYPRIPAAFAEINLKSISKLCTSSEFRKIIKM